MDSHDAVVDLASVAVVLPRGSDSFLAALGDAGLIHAADGVLVRMVLRHDLLAPVSQFLFLPLDRFEKALQRPWSGLETQGDCLSGLTVQIR